MAESTIDRIRLISVESGQGRANEAAWIVKMGYFVSGSEPMALVTWHLAKKDFDEGDVVRVARHYFHKLAGHLSEETRPWEIPSSELETLKKGAKLQPPNKPATS